MEYFQKNWPTIMAVGCVVIAAFIEAWQQASADSILPRLGGGWHYVPLFLSILAGIFWLIRILFYPFTIEPSSLTPATVEVQELAIQPTITSALPDFKFDTYFRLAHASQLTEQTERDMKLLVAQQHPNEREATLAKFIGMGYWGYLHELTWAYIFRSQILALTELNARGGMTPLSAQRTYYTKAKAEYPEYYAKYSFEQWLSFMQKTHNLLFQHPSDMIEITVRGRDFLKFLTHWGWSAEARKY